MILFVEDKEFPIIYITHDHIFSALTQDSVITKDSKF